MWIEEKGGDWGFYCVSVSEANFTASTISSNYSILPLHGVSDEEQAGLW